MIAATITRRRRRNGSTGEAPPISRRSWATSCCRSSSRITDRRGISALSSVIPSVDSSFSTAHRRSPVCSGDILRATRLCTAIYRCSSKCGRRPRQRDRTYSSAMRRKTTPGFSSLVAGGSNTGHRSRTCRGRCARKRWTGTIIFRRSPRRSDGESAGSSLTNSIVPVSRRASRTRHRTPEVRVAPR